MGFSAQIIPWYEQHHRRLPWRETGDPYKIWVSEIILQQTRVDHGLDYYKRIVGRFPDVGSLAGAGEEEVLKLWQGLGYYSRARNMHQAARQIVEDHGGRFPSTYGAILSLKGIGEYTASAVASFAFGLPAPVLDGNVARFITRLYGLTDPVNARSTRLRIKEILGQEIDRQRPGLFNQAIMEFGALQCVPRRPACDVCPLKDDCVAWNTGSVHKIPFKEKKATAKQRHFHYLVFYLEEKHEIFTLLEKRKGEDIWKNLYQFPLLEEDRLMDWEAVAAHPAWKEKVAAHDCRLMSAPVEITHILSHQRISARSFLLKCRSLPEGYDRVSVSDLHGYPVSRLMEKIIQRVNITFGNLYD